MATVCVVSASVVSLPDVEARHTYRISRRSEILPLQMATALTSRFLTECRVLEELVRSDDRDVFRIFVLDQVCLIQAMSEREN